jgi:flagellar M-ring protein FliF
VEFLRQLWDGITQAWLRLSTSARVNIGLAFLFTIAIVGSMVYFGSRPQYVTLFDGLGPEDMVAIQGQLEDENIPYRVDSTGQLVEVPIGDRSRLRVKLLAAGIPKTQGTLAGYETLGSSNFMQNQYAQEKGYQIALMGQLQRMLNEFSFVDKSFVQITEAKEEIFSDYQKPSEATVTLKVNRALKEEDIKAVLGCISTFGGVNLTRENINLVTVDGRVLNAPSEDDFDTIANSRLAYMKNYKNALEKSAEDALRQIGVRSVVRVSLDVEQSSITERREEVVSGAVVSSLTSESSTQNIETLPEGPSGARANLPADAPVPGGTGTVQTETQTLENFEPSRTTVETITGPGDVTVTRVTAIVEGRYQDEITPEGEATGEKAYVERTNDEIDTYTELVSAAVGVTGDSIEVRDHPFELEQLAAATTAFDRVETAAWQSDIWDIASTIGKLAAVVLLFFVVRYFLLRAAVSQDKIKEEVHLEIQRATPEERRRQEIAQEVERVSQDQPEAVASLLRTWLSEPEE